MQTGARLLPLDNQKILREEKRDVYKLFATPEQAAAALEDWINRFEHEEGEA